MASAIRSARATAPMGTAKNTHSFFFPGPRSAKSREKKLGFRMGAFCSGAMGSWGLAGPR